MTTQRDPRCDPQPGDMLTRLSDTRVRLTRTVLKRVNNDITYRDHRGKERTCWITSWLNWARRAEVSHVRGN